MQFILLFLAALLVGHPGNTQTVISGKVLAVNGRPLQGANITLKDSYYGASAGADGSFSFAVPDTGRFVLQFSMQGYQPAEKNLVLDHSPLVIDITLKEAVTELQAVVVSAGSFEASDKKRNTLLKPVDIVTTAGQQADIVAALKTLPGAQQVGETEGLFIRGGSGAETKIFIDGMMVTNPFFSSIPDIAQRGRFSPLLFKGTHFSSGGYSAQYGQGMSSALQLETHDLPSRSETDLIISSAQLSVSRLQLNKTKTASIAATVNYNNLQPYFSVVQQKLHYSKAPEIINGELAGKLKTKKGMLKFYSYANYNIIGLDKASAEQNERRDFIHLNNHHFFSILTYKAVLHEKWSMAGGVGYSYNRDEISVINKNKSTVFSSFRPLISNTTAQARAVFSRSFTGLNKLHLGAEYQHLADKIVAPDSIPFIKRADDYLAVFAEGDIYFTNKLALKPGLRFEHSSLLQKAKLSPRMALAYKLGEYAQVSAAVGTYYQKPETNQLFRQTALDFTEAIHYLLNYQLVRNGQTIRAELFYKQYRRLISYTGNGQTPLDNQGHGYARGFEVFLRDKKSIRDFDYWIAYSFLDTKRQYLDYPAMVQPGFAARHTVNVVAKKFVEKIATNFSLTYTYASGRPYYDPNLPVKDFMTSRTRDYHNLGLQLNYLTMIGKANAVFIINVNNALGTKQVYGYHFSGSIDNNGQYASQAVTPMARRSYFLGVYLSIGNDRRKQVIDN